MRVFSNTAISADGKIGTRNADHVSIGSAVDRRRMGELRARADCVLVGGQTFRAWPLPLVEPPPAVRGRPVCNAVVTRRGLLATRERPGTWPDPRVDLVVFAQEGIDVDAHRRRFGCAVETSAFPGVNWVLDRLSARGAEVVLVEGGGDLIFQLLRADRLDEMFVTVCPKIVGGAGAPTLADGDGFLPGDFPRLSLVGVRREGDELFLHYSVERGVRC